MARFFLLKKFVTMNRRQKHKSSWQTNFRPLNSPNLLVLRIFNQFLKHGTALTHGTAQQPKR